MTLTHSSSPTGPVTPADDRPFLRHGRMLSLGAAAWAVAMLLVGIGPEGQPGLAITGIGGGLFQVGLLFLLRVLWRTRALGEGRLARAVLRVEAVFVSLAMCSTIADAIEVSDMSNPVWALLDAFWPFSMLGMFFIGIRIAIAGRWTGASRFWPMVAESWAVVVIPTLGIFGETVAQHVAWIHLLVGYTVLGVLVSRKQS